MTSNTTISPKIITIGFELLYKLHLRLNFIVTKYCHFNEILHLSIHYLNHGLIIKGINFGVN